MRAVNLELLRLDDVLSEHLADVAFIKIDVDDHELYVLSGARELLQRLRPALIVAAIGQSADATGKAAPVFALLHDYGYAISVQDGSAIRPRRSEKTAVE